MLIQMEFTSRTVFLLAVVGLTVAFPAAIDHSPEQGDKFEGDMVLSAGQRLYLQFGTRNGLINTNYRWPENKVFYKFTDGHFDTSQLNRILLGMELIEDKSCIRFYPADPSSTSFVTIQGTASGCFSNVGYLNMPQVLNLQVNGCLSLGTIVHEFLHTLGFFHQHSASDRDKFVKIVLENVEPGKELNFETYDRTVVGDFGVAYDYNSVMHYGTTAFSKNGEKTIIPLKASASIGQRFGLSSSDIKKLNLMYKCSPYVERE